MDRNITDEQARNYAEHLIRDHAYDIEGLSIHEMVGDYFDDYELDLTREDFDSVREYIRKSKLTIEFES